MKVKGCGIMSVLLLKIGVGIAYLFMIVMNGLANALPFFGRTTGEVSDAYPNQLTPSGFAFSIWGVIYILLGVMVIKILMMDTNTLNGASMRLFVYGFIASSVFNGLWLLAWHSLIPWLSLLVMVGLIGSLILMYLNRPLDVFWLKLPISIYLGWISVATILNITILLSTTEFIFKLPESFYFILVLIAGIVLVLLMLLRHGDVPYALVFFWAYFAIFIRHLGEDNPLLYGTSGVAGVVLLLMTLFTLYTNGYELYAE
jgi:hypothetical protein